MKAIVLISDKGHPIYKRLVNWKDSIKDIHQISICNSVDEINDNAHILFLVSCTEIVTKKIRSFFDYTLVLHASDLPEGRGWSPHIWKILEGKNKIVLSLLSAEDKVDTGDIWKKVDINLTGYELYDEINEKLFDAEIHLMNWSLDNIKTSSPTPQKKINTVHYRKRTPKDSKLDINKPLKDQFNLLRIGDPDRYPCYFEIDDHKYKIIIEKLNE